MRTCFNPPPTFLFLTELLINAIIVEIYLCNNYKKKYSEMKSTANIAQSEQTPDPAQPKWVEIPFICHWP